MHDHKEKEKEANEQERLQKQENKTENDETLAEWLYRSLPLPAWKAETPSNFDTIQIDEYNWTKSDRDKREVIPTDVKSINHSDVIVDEYNWKAPSEFDSESKQKNTVDKWRQKVQSLDHSEVICDEYNWTPSSTSALKDIQSNKSTSEESWPSVYDHGDSKS